MVERVKTGISGFDTLVEGGVPENSVTLISGAPGTGKSIFCMQYLAKGCEAGDLGIFLSFEQSEADVISQVSRFNWNLRESIDQGKLIVKHVDIMEQENIFDYLKEVVPTNRRVRLVIDSLTALQNYPAMLRNADRLIGLISQKRTVYGVSEDSVRRMLIHYFIGLLKSFKNATSFLITDVPDESNKLSSDGISEFMCDGVVSLYYLGLGGESARNLQVRKMRWTNQTKGFFPFNISENGVMVSEEGKSVLMQ